MNVVQAVSAILTAYRPHFPDADFSPARRWLDQGCDLERDILPVIREWAARKPDIRSLGFFTRYVLAAKAARTAVAPVSDPHRRARHIAYLTRVLGRCMPTDQRWLESWERAHGPIESLRQLS